MITPIINTIYHEEARCPQCGKKENRIEVCKHCGHEYESTESDWVSWVIISIGLIVIVWVSVTVLTWFTNSEDTTLMSVLSDQLNWIKTLRIY
jgi:uncharacterized protein (DUF983 family)